jgi:hypothetical protein
MLRREDAMHKPFAGAVITTATAAIALLLVDCGGGGSSTTTRSSTSTVGNASVCGAYAQVKSAGSSVE